MSFDLKEVEKSLKGVFATTREKEVALQTYQIIADIIAKLEDLETRFATVVNMINKHGEVLGGLLKVEKAFSVLENVSIELEQLKQLPKTIEAVDAKIHAIESELDTRFPSRTSHSKKGKEKIVPLSVPEPPITPPITPPLTPSVVPLTPVAPAVTLVTPSTKKTKKDSKIIEEEDPFA